MELVLLPEFIYLGKNTKIKKYITAPKISIEEFNNKLTVYKDAIITAVRSDLPKGLVESFKYYYGGSPIIYINKEAKLTRNRVPYLSATPYKDGPNEFRFYIYWDGEKLRAYVPKRGNRIINNDLIYANKTKTYNFISQYLVNSYGYGGYEYKKVREMLQNLNSLTWFIRINDAWCLEEFEKALGFCKIIDYEWN